MSPTYILVSSALFHAAWNASLKTARDKETFLVLAMIASCFFSGIAIASFEPFDLGSIKGIVATLGAGVFEMGYLLSLARAFHQASLSRAYAIIRGGAMVIVWFVSLLFLRESIDWVGGLGSLLVLSGIWVNQRNTKEEHHAERFGAAYVSAVSVAGYHICYDVALQEGARPISLFLTSLVFSLPFLFIPLRGKVRTRIKTVWLQDYKKIIFAGVITTLSFSFFLYGLKDSAPGYAITLRNTSIFFAVLLGLFLGERPTRLQIFGITVIAVGALLLGQTH